MKAAFYPRLAWDGLRRNRRMSWPYLLTCVCMVAVHYILGFLASPAALDLLPKGRLTMETMLTFGRYVMLAFSLVFLFYTHSFLIRRRAREFGLYNVLGMGKNNLARVITWESLITFALSLAGGLLAGLALSKLAELGLVNLMGGEVDYRLRLDAASLIRTAASYSGIFALIWLSAVIRTARSTAVSLMKAESVGEKPPRGNWILALLGAAALAAAYWLAVSVESPIDALMWFFVAVLLVIIATYLLMISGSVRLCRLLQANKGYYYRPKHFVSVSSMAYRMKRNGAGLASICVIATMVLVMLSTTTCMWFGTEDALRTLYPRDFNLRVTMNSLDQLSDANLDRFRSAISAFAAEKGAAMDDVQDYHCVVLDGVRDGDFIQCDYENASAGANYSDLCDITLISAGEYAARTGETLALSPGEAALLADKTDYGYGEITLAMGEVSRAWKVVSVKKGTLGAQYAAITVPQFTLIVPDLSAAIEGFSLEDENGLPKAQILWMYGFDTGLSDAENMRFTNEMDQALTGIPFDAGGELGYRGYITGSRADGAADFYGTFGGLFFIGILLSAVFLVAAVLIIYYKQVSEGYEDAGRFGIMRKVGMTRREIRASIRSQLLTVFALPLAFAGLHLAFAFPMIRKLLTLSGLDNAALFARTTLISFAVFAAFYALVYRLTSGVYLRIVSRTGASDPA